MPGPGQDYYSMIWSLITEPIFKGLFTGVVQSVRRGRRPGDLHDESVASFFHRRLGTPDMANNIFSAVLHGIYAGDIDQLSMKSLFPHAWYLDGVHDKLLDVLSSRITTIEDRDARLYNDMEPKINDRLKDLMRRAAVYTFKRGIGTLSDALEKSLRTNPNVEFKMNHKVNGIEYEAELDGIKVSLNVLHTCPN
jgi:protoporphyrinogen/coproporphyrinogen III oxidase